MELSESKYFINIQRFFISSQIERPKNYAKQSYIIKSQSFSLSIPQNIKYFFVKTLILILDLAVVCQNKSLEIQFQISNHLGDLRIEIIT